MNECIDCGKQIKDKYYRCWKHRNLKIDDDTLGVIAFAIIFAIISFTIVITSIPS